ncbi:MAG: hypothetical protein EXS36_13415 [Pedosphaera sp.]|nr:hypothetical protein [Pedosphaera sp.]
MTLLFLTSNRIIRADFPSKGSSDLQQVWKAAAAPGATVSALAEAAYALGPANRARVWVLNSLSWTQIVTVPATKVGGLEGQELSSALSFEAEAMSGISPFDSMLGAVPAPAAAGDNSFWVTQLSAGELVLIEESLGAKGAKLLGIVHPGGLVRPWSSTGSAPAPQRVELWQDVVLTIDMPPGSAPQVNALSASPAREDWRLEAEQWFTSRGSHGSRSILSLEAVQPGGDESHEEICSLDDDATLRAWLTAWAIELSTRTPRAPLVKPLPKPMADSTRFAIGVGLTLIALAFCAGHSFWLQGRQKTLQIELVKAEQPAQQLQTKKAEADSLQLQVAQLKQQAASLRQLRNDWKESIKVERRRHAGLLQILVSSVPTELTLSSVDEQAGVLNISGLSVVPHLESFATNLAAGAEPLRWRYEPPRRRALNFADSGGPWLLDWTLPPITNVVETPTPPTAAR